MSMPCQEQLPPQPLSGMVNKHGSKVRLTFKLEEDQVWLGTKGSDIFTNNCWVITLYY